MVVYWIFCVATIFVCESSSGGYSMSNQALAILDFWNCEDFVCDNLWAYWTSKRWSGAPPQGPQASQIRQRSHELLTWHGGRPRKPRDSVKKPWPRRGRRSRARRLWRTSKRRRRWRKSHCRGSTGVGGCFQQTLPPMSLHSATFRFRFSVHASE